VSGRRIELLRSLTEVEGANTGISVYHVRLISFSKVSVQLINWVLQLIAAGFSAVVGAAALLALQTALRRGRFLRALQSELELNQNRVERQIRRLEAEAEKTRQAQFPSYHTEVYETVRVNDPTLFLKLHSEILGLENLYEGLNQLDDLSEPGVSTTASREEILERLRGISESADNSLETVKELREENFIYRRIGKEGASLRVKHIELGEEKPTTDE